MSNPYANLSNISALPPSFFQNNPNMANLNMANLQQMGQSFGMNMGNLGQGQQSQQAMYPPAPQPQQQPQQQFNMAALANIPLSALDGIQLPNQMNQASMQQQQQQLHHLQQQQNSHQSQPNNIHAALQTYHRIQAQDRAQAQESQKLEQQRLGMGVPQNNAQQPQGLSQGQPGQQFIQQMNNMARIQMQQQDGQQMRNMNGVNMQAVMAGMAAQGDQGQNMHSQQQGLQLGGQNVGGDDDTEVGRRMALQNMLSQNYSQNASSQQPNQHTPYQQQLQLPQFQQQQEQQRQASNTGLQPEVLQAVMNLPPEQRDPILAKYNANMPAAMQELLHMHVRGNVPNMVQQPQQVQGRTTPNMQAAQVRMPQPVQAAQQVQGRAYGHQRSDSQQMGQMQVNQVQGQAHMQGQMQMQNQGQMSGQMQVGQGQMQMQGNQGQNGQGINYDPKQFEALQQMRERQQRQQGTVTPLMGPNAALPMVSPQPQQQSQHIQMAQMQQAGQYRQTPQNNPAQLPQQPMQQLQQQPQQQPQQQQQQSAFPQQAQAGRPKQEEPSRRRMADTVREWSDEQLRSNTTSLLRKMVNPKEDPTRFHLLTLIAEFKRRGLDVPPEAITAIGGILSNPVAVNQVLAASWQHIQSFAQRSANHGQFRPPQLPQQAVSAQPQRQVSVTGGQGNPIEIATPKLNTPALPAQSTPTQQNLFHPGHLGHQRQPSFSGQNVATQQQPVERAWAGMDYRDEAISFSEMQAWHMLGKLHKKPDLTVPSIEGRPVDIYALLGLVHKNGGASRMDQNPAMWQIIAGQLGLGQPPGDPPSRPSPQLVAELRRIYAHYLSIFEDAWYSKIYDTRSQRNVQPNLHATQTQSGPVDQSNQSTQNQAFGAIPPQLLEMAMKNPGALSEQQRQMIETARLANSTPVMNAGTPSLTSAMPQAPAYPNLHYPNLNLQLAAQSLRGNPSLCLNWIKTKEEGMRLRFPPQPVRYADVPEHQRPAVGAELRSLAGAAKDAQDKMPKYLLVAAEKGLEEFSRVSSLIQLYMAILISFQHAEQGNFCFAPDYIDKLKYQLASLITGANTLYEEYRAGPEGPARVERLLQGLPKTSPRDPTAALAASMPKGLRVEDLKPPPLKRAKGRGVNSPAAAVLTPEAAKTPASHVAESPVATSSPASRKPSTKRKRTSTNVKEEKDETVGEMAPPPAPLPVDSIPTTEADIELAQARAFFKARSDLEKGQTDVWSALASAAEEYNTVEPAPTADFFPNWIDSSQMCGLPTPELYIPNQLEEPDTSPESIKTVGSTSQVTPPVFSTEKEESWEEKRLIDMSPGSVAYNGGLFWDEYDFENGVGV